MRDQDEIFMRQAIALSALAVEHGNEPFGAVLVKDGQVVYTNENQIHTAADPTFHAEAGLLRRFCGTFWCIMRPFRVTPEKRWMNTTWICATSSAM